MSSSSASSSPSPPTPPPKVKKRKQKTVEKAESSDSSSDSEEDDGLEPGDEAGAPSEREPSPEVISHAERRKRKKEEKRAARDDAPPAKKRKGEDGSAVPAAAKGASAHDKSKRQNSVWVGNMAFKSTPDSLRGFFDGVGEITRIHMPMKPGGKGENMGFAYVDFSSPDAKIIAIALSERPLEGRNLLIKDGGDFTGRPAEKKEPPPGAEAPADGSEPTSNGKPGATKQTGMTKTAQKILRIQKQPPAPTLFLGNLGFETTEDGIRGLFEAHRHPRGSGKGKGKEEEGGEADPGAGAGADASDAWIRKIRMGTFEDSGKCKGFAFVDFTSIEHATAALVNPHNHRLNGRELVVEYASADAVRRGGGGGGPRQDAKGRPQRREREKQRENGGRADRAPRSESAHQEEDGEEGDDAEADTQSFRRERPPHAKFADRGSRPQKRAKPGAALARAPRETAAILPSQGQKIVF